MSVCLQLIRNQFVNQTKISKLTDSFFNIFDSQWRGFDFFGGTYLKINLLRCWGVCTRHPETRKQTSGSQPEDRGPLLEHDGTASEENGEKMKLWIINNINNVLKTHKSVKVWNHWYRRLIKTNISTLLPVNFSVNLCLRERNSDESRSKKQQQKNTHKHQLLASTEEDEGVSYWILTLN